MRPVGRAVLGAVACVLALGACGRGSVVETPTGAAAAPAVPPPDGPPVSPDQLDRPGTTRRSSTARPRRVFVDLNTAVFWERFEVRLRQASFTPSGYGASGVLVVSATFVNHTLDRAMLDLADVALDVDGQRLPAGLSKVPVLEAGATRSGTLGFWLPDGFDLASTTIAFGADDTNQSLVPLDRPAETVTIAPQPVALRGLGGAANVQVAVTGGHISPSYRPAERGLGLLRLSFDIAYSGDDPLGLVLESTDFVLVLPDGAEVPGAAVASDDLALEIVPARGKLTGQEVTFVVPLPVADRYSVRYTAPAGEIADIAVRTT